MSTNEKRALRAMKAAARTGFDPRNSAIVFGEKFSRSWHDECRRSNSEFDANLWLDHALNWSKE
jgi:hypothetical protein